MFWDLLFGISISRGLFGGMRRRDQERHEEAVQDQRANQQAVNYEQNRSKYNRAFKSCMEGRGYRVK